MARPWKKRWPYISKSGRKTYWLGFRDHDGVERTKSFASTKAAKEWADLYVSSERRGIETLRRFLLDLDAKDANCSTDDMTIGEVVQLYFAFNAPDTPDGLSTSTFHTYRYSAKRHLLGHPGVDRGREVPPAPYAVRFAAEPAAKFNEPAAPRAWREGMKHAGVGSSARVHAWRVLSAVLSWAAGSDQVPSIESNGCLFANEKIGNRRKSTRSANGRASVRRQGDEVQSWALSPKSVELLRLEMMRGVAHPTSPILSLRDATIVSLQFGLALRNQEVYGLRWSSFMVDQRVRIADVLSWDAIDELGKTEKATGRIADVPELLSADLADWRTLLTREGFPVGGAEFVISGNLAGAHYGAIDERTGACHMSKNQAQKWRPRCMKPALSAAAGRNPAWALIADATPYSLRRGGISARLRGESAQSVADQCGTSLEMLSRHYSYEIDGFGRGRPETLDEQWQRARASVPQQPRDDDLHLVAA